MKQFSGRLLQFLDVMVFYSLILVAVVIYFTWSNEIAIWIMVGLIVFYSVLYIPSFFKKVQIWRFRHILRFCHQYPLAREEFIVKGLKIDPTILHQKLYQLAYYLTKGPIIVLVKRYYLYVRDDVVEFAFIQLQKNFEMGNMKTGDIIKDLGQKFEFESRLEIEALISRIREVRLKTSANLKKTR